MTRPAGSAHPIARRRVVLITGASSGIGRATANAFAAQGDTVVGVGRDRDRLQAVHDECGAEVIQSSIETARACVEVVDHVHRRFGPIDILVNNAGRGGYLDESIDEATPEGWRKMIAVNLDAPFELTRLSVADMRKRRWGRIIMVGSTASQVGAPNMTGYCASKHGLLGLMRAVANDVAADHVTCNAVCPGWVRTEMAERDAEIEAEARGLTPSDVWKEREAASPARRVLEPTEVANVVAFLGSDLSSGINGEAITVALGGAW